jgi:hypothetical protein
MHYHLAGHALSASSNNLIISNAPAAAHNPAALQSRFLVVLMRRHCSSSYILFITSARATCYLPHLPQQYQSLASRMRLINKAPPSHQLMRTKPLLLKTLFARVHKSCNLQPKPLHSCAINCLAR